MKTLQESLGRACARIAPTWPLDRFIAVNPFWGFTDLSLEQASQQLGKLCGGPSLALQPAGKERAQQSRLPLFSDLWGELACEQMVDSISQICATYFDQGQASWRPQGQAGLYSFWREQMAHDPTWLRLCGKEARNGLGLAHELVIEQALAKMNLAGPALEEYLTALLLRLNGWSAWCAYLGWQAGLKGEADDSLQQLLAVRLAWDWMALRKAGPTDLDWLARLSREAEWQSVGANGRSWEYQKSQEQAYQQGFASALVPAAPLPDPGEPVLQAVFCIDVRSEVFRRALEACDGSIQTLGFAGFFGIPASFTPLGTSAPRPQLPGLLAPAMQIEEQSESPNDLVALRQGRLQRKSAWEEFRFQPLSAFPLVESLGLSYAFHLLAASFGWLPKPTLDDQCLSTREKCRLRPTLVGLSPEKGVALVEGILRSMSLTDRFAPLVLLLGHGSSSRNNPHASGLDCGACCGQTGEVNCRALADLLNDPQIRQGLAHKNLCIPPHTRFVAGLHNTTSDEITLFEKVNDPTILQWLQQATDQARQERAEALGISCQNSQQMSADFHARTRDWSQVRPEWGLANNASFLAAPRARSRGVNLSGRCFLHEYCWENDADGSVLEQIMTAPLVVAHWINMQYYASVADPRRWGSGNKVLHNVVGGNLGVFEGGGGDLRIGLPWQSVHSGEDWMHTPLRLSAFFEAPQKNLERVLEKHEKVRQLVEGCWLYLLRIDPSDGQIYRYHGNQGNHQWERPGEPT